MKAFFAALLLLTAWYGTARAHDILVNGDFADGSAHWQGDTTGNADSTNLVITLKHDSWTKIYQTFNSQETALKLSVTFTYSENCTFLPENGTSGFALSDGVIREVTGIQMRSGILPIRMGGFIAFVVDPPNKMVNSSIVNGVAASADEQTASGFFYKLTPHQDKVFYLAFPPGNGTVTLTHVALEPAPEGPTNN